jgi:Nif-specific regulatory protein
MHCNWPGNVRELENCIERAGTMTRGNLIRESDMRCQKGQCFSSVLIESTLARSCFPVIGAPPGSRVAMPIRSAPAAPEPLAPPPPAPVALAPPASEAFAADDPGDEDYVGERDRLIEAMERCGWVQAKAARLLGLTPRQIGYALKKCNVEIKRL